MKYSRKEKRRSDEDAEPGPRADSFARFEALCRESGRRLTPQRLEVYGELFGARDHPSAEMLYRRVRRRMPTITLDTVYRTLDTLQQMDLAVCVGVIEGVQRFEADMSCHHHFVCQRCSAIVDLQFPSLKPEKLAADMPEGYRITRTQLELRGICPSCNEAG